MTLKEAVREYKPSLYAELEVLKRYKSSVVMAANAAGSKATLDKQYDDKLVHQLPGIDPLNLTPKFYDKNVVKKPF